MDKKKKAVRLLVPLLIVFAVISVSLVTLELARFVMDTGEVKNNLTPAHSVDPTVQEIFVDNVKSDVCIRAGDTGYPVYIRAGIVVTWQDKNGTVYYKSPAEGTDYEISLDLTDGWIKGDDDFYYYTAAVGSGGVTSVLIKHCDPLTEAPAEGYTLNVSIIAQSVQAIGYTDGENEREAYKDAWDIDTALDPPKDESSEEGGNDEGGDRSP